MKNRFVSRSQVIRAYEDCKQWQRVKPLSVINGGKHEKVGNANGDRKFTIELYVNGFNTIGNPRVLSGPKWSRNNW